MIKGEKKYGYIILLSILLVFTYSVFVIQSESNDDPGMMEYISGFYTGRPGILPYIMGTPYSFIVSKLYTITSVVPWYGLIFVLVSIASVAAIGKCLVSVSEDSLIPKALFVGLFFALFLYELVQIQFTMVAGLAGSACVILTLHVGNKCDKHQNTWLEIVLASGFMFFAYNIRFQCGILSLLVLYYVVGAKRLLLKRKSREQIVVLISCTAIVILSWGINNAYINNTEWKQYEKLNSERSLYMDTEKIAYEDNVALYDNIGWDEALYNLITRWCFMTEEACYEDFSYLNAAKESEVSATPREKLIKLASDLKMFVKKQSKDTAIMMLEFIMLVAVIWMHFGKTKKVEKKYIPEIMYLLGFLFFQAAFVFYLILFGRYGTRVLLMIFSITGVPFLYCTTERICLMESGIFKRRIIVIVSIVAIVGAILGLQRVNDRKINDYEVWDDVHEYVMENRNNIYVGDGSMIYPERLFQSFEMGKSPVNYFFWGGWLRESPFNEEQMKANGINQLYLEDMLKENYYFIGNEKNMKLLNDYYESRYEKVDAEIYYRTDTYIVYGFREID